MREMYFDVWAGDDLLGTSLGELTDASEKKITVVDNGMGGGSFIISRHSAQYAMVTPGPTTSEPLIRVRRVTGGPFAYDDTRYIHAFFVEEGDDVLVSPDEEGGEDATRSGRGAESILSRAVIDFEAHYVDDIVNHPYDRTTLTDGQWHFDETIPGSFMNVGTPGAVLRVLLRNAGAQVPEPIVEVTHDFSVNVDSTLTPWTDGDAKWSFDVGTDLLSVLGILVNSELYYHMSPALLLQAYVTQPGTDLSASITFTQSADIAEAGTRAIHGSPAKSRLLVQGTTDNGQHKFRWVADTGIEAVLGVRQGSLDYQASPTNAILDKAGTKMLADLQTQHDGPPTLGVDEVAGQEAFIDYEPGDTVTVDIPGVFDVEPTRIHSITLSETDTGEVDVAVEFRGETWAGIAGPIAATGDGLACPFFVDDGANALGRSMRMRDTGNGIYTQIHAGNETDDKIAWLEANVTTDAYVYLFATNTDPGSWSWSEITLGGEGTLELKGGLMMELSVGNEDTSKHHFFGGQGIVLPILPADPPAGAASQEGQVYFNSVSGVPRVHDGATWTDIGAGGGGGDPALVYIVDDDSVSDSGTPGVRFAGTFGGDNADYIGAKVVDAGVGPDRDARLFLHANSGGVWFDLTAKDEDTGKIADIYGDATYGSIDIDASRSIGLIVRDTNTDSKHLLSGGHGLVVPLLAADPSGANSQAGQMYFNTGSNTFRGYNGTSWGTLALT